MKNFFSGIFGALLASSSNGAGGEAMIGKPAPLFKASTHDGQNFDLAMQKGKWTILYFYPKADTPGCTKQACAFRDKLDLVRKQNAEVYGISSDDVASLAQFHKKYHLNFTLLADPNLAIIESYGAKMPALKISKRWTFIIDPDLNVKYVDKDVDPVKDAEQMAQKLAEFQEKK